MLVAAPRQLFVMPSQWLPRAAARLAPTPTRTQSTSLCTSARHLQRRGFAVVVSQERMEEFLTAEIAYLGRGKTTTITVEQILARRGKKEIAQLILEELPSRFAKRIVDIEKVTQDFAEIPGLKELHACLSLSFRRLQLIDPNAVDWLTHFHEVIVDLRERHRQIIIRSLAETARQLRAQKLLSDQATDEWVMQFMMSRLGTEMLTKHFISYEENSASSGQIGVVDMRCRPAEICQQAIDHLHSNFDTSGLEFNLRVDKGDIEFSFIPSYLFYMVEELLKNILKVATTRDLLLPAQRKVQVHVAAEQRRVGIKISDTIGGVLPEVEDKIWQFNFSTFPLDNQKYVEASSPLSGPGMGLPLCKLYAHYLGGELHLMSMPGVGTDTYLFFNTVDYSIAEQVGNKAAA
mmetsp:Transcript_32515/g.74296  ORF Transcript_32515/g.74296 Transcript_32515/m.74296 type:complete len:405 (-) Transcript_32515:60-1274(-)